MDLSDFTISDSELSCSELSDSESNQSTPEEERIVRLFQTCDSDGDGFITADDIQEVCNKLNLDYSANEIMEQLGPDSSGRISFCNFAKRKIELLDHKDTDDDILPSDSQSISLMQTNSASSLESSRNNEQASSLSSSSQENQSFSCNSINKTNNKSIFPKEKNFSHYKQEVVSLKNNENLNLDSENEIITLHKLIETSDLTLPSNINQLLDLANELHISSMVSLKKEIISMKNKIETLTKERDYYQQEYFIAKDNLSLLNDKQKNLYKKCKKYEAKIIELQCVIAEMSQKIIPIHCMTIEEENNENSHNEQ